MPSQPETSEFIRYLADHAKANPLNPQLPSLKVLSDELGISVAQLREQLEAAKALGVSRATADRYWAYAKAYLYAAFEDTAAGEEDSSE